MPPRLTVGALALRPVRAHDIERLEAILEQPGVREWWGMREDREHARAGLRNRGAAFVIEVDGALAGWLGYSEEEDPDHRHAGLDIFLDGAHQGQRIGRAALRAAGLWLFDERGHHRLTIDPACQNERAIRAYAAVGFRPVGVMRRYERGEDGRWHDNLLMDLLRDELREHDS